MEIEQIRVGSYYAQKHGQSSHRVRKVTSIYERARCGTRVEFVTRTRRDTQSLAKFAEWASVEVNLGAAGF